MRITTANMGLAIAGGQWLIEVLCFYFTFVLADNLVLRNARHRQAPNRCASLLKADPQMAHLGFATAQTD